jgi:hypothetical protein
MEDTSSDQTKIDAMIQKIIRQTDYTEQVAREKLEEHHFDEILVIKDFFGILDKKKDTDSTPSLNQEIYKQLRTKMNSSKIPKNLLPTV